MDTRSASSPRIVHEAPHIVPGTIGGEAVMAPGRLCQSRPARRKAESPCSWAGDRIEIVYSIINILVFFKS